MGIKGAVIIIRGRNRLLLFLYQFCINNFSAQKKIREYISKSCDIYTGVQRTPASHTSPTPTSRMRLKVNFKTNYNRLEFGVFLLLDRLPSLPNYLLISEGRIAGFIPFPRVLVICEMQAVSSGIRTRVGVSISYDDDNYNTSTSVGWYLSFPASL